MERKLYSARLERKVCISETAQCYHFDFAIDELESFPFTSGQFVSTVAPDQSGKQQTRAYSIASAPRGNHFDLCVNRVEGGFFSNHLADLTELPPGGSVNVHGPHGHFVLKQPLTDSILISTGTGIAPMRGFAQWLFPEDGPDRSEGRDIWMVYGTRHESELYYHEEFEALAAKKPNFHYLATLSRAGDSWKGLRGYVQEHVARLLKSGPHGSDRLCRWRRLTPAHRLPSSIRHLRVHLRTEQHGRRSARKARGIRLAPQADHLRALRLRIWLRQG